MKMIKAKDYSEMSRKAAGSYCITGDYEAELCAGTGDWFFPGGDI